ncbi:MAG: universal stress protein, partial [Chloroflexota bacterium]|nr:universal stress protein [Chloroflexota bacterium]
MYQKILVPLDGSRLAEIVLPYAEELGGKLGSEIILIHVCESADCPHRHLHEYYLQKMVDDTVHYADNHLRNQVPTQIKVKSAILVGDPSQEIGAYADTEDVGLIVMATHGLTGLKRWAFGSVAGKTVRST